MISERLDMKIQLLYEFIQVAESLHFTRASYQMNLTQPVLSRHMKWLETYFGTPLFMRNAHKVEITPAGKLLYGEACKIIQQYEKSMSAMKIFVGQSQCRLRIAFLGEAINHFLVKFLMTFQQKHADIVVECHDRELDDMMRLLEDKTYDLGFWIRPNFIKNKKFCTLPIQKDPLCVAVNKDHPFALRERVSLKEVGEWPLICVAPRDFFLAEEFSTHFFDEKNINLTCIKEYPNLKTCCFNLKLMTQGVLLLPLHRKHLIDDDSVLIDILEKDCWFNLELVWDHKNDNSCIDVFLNEFKQYLCAENPAFTEERFL